ncbi:hypothetical protein FQN57_004604 [Myotisia sp. PD_48]|nr:hypothetical protein FQN57_004604 [Myotisia sp. PD_48]
MPRPPESQRSALKRSRAGTGNQNQESPRRTPRRSERIASQLGSQSQQQPRQQRQPQTRTPVIDRDERGATIPPPVYNDRSSHPQFSDPIGSSQIGGDTQAFSQPATQLAFGVEDEVAAGVWGYLIPMDSRLGDTLVLQKRDSPLTTPDAMGAMFNDTRRRRRGNRSAANELRSGAYLVGRHEECNLILEIPTISNRHCLLFNESRQGDSVAVIEDLSSNGTFVNDAIIGRNKCRDLEDGDEITLIDHARFLFRYPRFRLTSGFNQQYQIGPKLGQGYYATVYQCTERNTGTAYAVKKFEKRHGESQLDSSGFQQEVAILKSVTHPNLLCLQETFQEADGFYIVLELAPGGELFSYIVQHQKLSEGTTRRIFKQLFQGLKYLHERNIIHRDIKPENILMVNRDHVKLADFGLAKIIGEDSFTTTLCGTPNYAAPEIFQGHSQRRYARPVDVWSLGVVLYICLCGFPPFSDEMMTPEFPYTLQQQIRLGAFEWTSPYWDNADVRVMNLIECMLTVEPEDRITVDGCIDHPWMRDSYPSMADSTDGLTGAMNNLEFTRRRVTRQRTLLSSINDSTFRVPAPTNDAAGERRVRILDPIVEREPRPADNRSPAEFMQMGGAGDMQLYSDDDDDDDDDELERGRKRRR